VSAALAAMILAAGRGERMHPLTAARAKPALPVLGRPLVARILAHLAGQGVTSFAVNAWHAPGSIEAACAASGVPPAAIELFAERELMGTGGALVAPAARLAEGPHFLLHNGDTLLDVPLAALRAAAESASLGALLVRPGRDPRYRPVSISGDRFAHLGPAERPGELDATYLGVAVLSRALLDRVRRDRPSDLFRDLLLPEVAGGGTLAVVLHPGRWIEFTSPARYRAHCCSLALSDAPLVGGAASVTRLGSARVAIAAGADVETGAIVDGGVVLETGARAARGASITGSVLLEGAEVAGGALIWQTIVMPGARVPPGAAFRDGVVERDGEGQVRCVPFVDVEPA